MTEKAPTIEQLAEWLHEAGLNAFTHPSGYGGDIWHSYRLNIAAYLHNKLSDQNIDDGD